MKKMIDRRDKSERVYVASSWRNELLQQAAVATIRAAGIEVYDFREPTPGSDGFHWSEIDPEYKSWKAKEYIKALQHPIAEAGFKSDFDAMKWADTFVLVLPCGRSAHLEMGWAIGQGKRTIILTQDGEEPELMAKMADHITSSWMDMLAYLGVED